MNAIFTRKNIKKTCRNALTYGNASDIILSGGNLRERNRKENRMYETVKTVKGYAITRMIGSKGCYHVSVREGRGFREFHTFRTIKAAAEFIEKAL